MECIPALYNELGKGQPPSYKLSELGTTYEVVHQGSHSR